MLLLAAMLILPFTINLRIYDNPIYKKSKIFNNTENLNTVENFDENSTNIEVEWHKYWREYGNQIVYSSWLNLYGDYIHQDDNIEHLNSKVIGEKKNLEENFDTKHNDAEVKFDTEETDISMLVWQKLWDEHYLHEYSSCFYLFSQNFYKAERNFHLNKEFDFKSNNSSGELFITTDDTDELRALGLPTAFSTSSKYFKNRHKNTFIAEEYSSEEEEDQMDEYQNDILHQSQVEIQNNCKEIQNQNTNTVSVNLQNNEFNKPPRKRKTKKRQLREIPTYIREDKSLIKYWRKRFQLFSRFDEGIKLDKESWFSVTPEQIAKSIADKMSHCDIVIDGFCGSGGNCIQLAMKCKKVIAIDIDPIKIEMAKHNAKIYKVDKKIEFIIGDFLTLLNSLKADGICLSTPWGGPNYLKHSIYDIEKFLQPLPASELLKRCRTITENIVMFIPKNSDKQQIIKLAGVGKQVEIVQNFLDDRLVAYSCYFGNLVNGKT